MNIVKYYQQKPDAAFTEIKGENIGSATTRFTMQWGEYNLKRIEYTPYGYTDTPAVWHVDETIISNLTIEEIGNTIAKFLEDKWLRETSGKIIPLV